MCIYCRSPFEILIKFARFVKQTKYDCRSPFEIQSKKKRKVEVKKIEKVLPFSFWDSFSSSINTTSHTYNKLPFSFWDSFYISARLYVRFYNYCRSPFEILENVGYAVVDDCVVLPFSFWDSEPHWYEHFPRKPPRIAVLLLRFRTSNSFLCTLNLLSYFLQ